MNKLVCCMPGETCAVSISIVRVQFSILSFDVIMVCIETFPMLLY